MICLIKVLGPAQSTISASQGLQVNLLFWFRLFRLKNLVPFL